jgi:AcrR family transcriptional regulator
LLLYYLNMFKTTADNHRTRKSSGERTKQLILEKALELFRDRGFEVSTMRDIASAAKVATGAAYYYFPSKEAIVSAYYDQVQQLHAERVRKELGEKEGLRDRLAMVMHSKLEILKDDRRFLGALFRYTGEPGHPLSVFGKGTEVQRRQSVEIFREAVAGADVNEELKQILPWGMWLAHLGIILFFIHDESDGQEKTHKLVDRLVDVLVGIVELTSSALVRPFVSSFQSKMVGILREAGWNEKG